MSRVLYAWELGGNYGHMGNFLPLGLALRDRGHEVIVAAKDLSRIDDVLGKRGFPVLQCPVWLAKAKGLPEPIVTYADILLRVGFIEKTALAGLVKAWRQLYAVIKPDLLIVDHGPRALLAAQGTGIRRALLGGGFFVPPPVTPLPCIRPWLQVPEGRLTTAEEKALETANAVLRDLGMGALDAIPDLFEVDENFLCTMAELDPYHTERSETNYWGPINTAEWGVKPPWPPGKGKKVFAYLSTQYRQFEKSLEILAGLPCPVLVYVFKVREETIKKYTSENLHFSKEPVDMDYARKTCDVAVCHAGDGTTTAMLQTGRPLLMLPLNLENELMARSVVKEGAGLTPWYKRESEDFEGAVLKLIEDPSYTERAQAFARRYAHLNPEVQLAEMVKRCEEIMASKG